MFNINDYITNEEEDGFGIEIPVDWTLHTNGRGYWSSVAKPVRVTALSMYVAKPDTGEDGYFMDSDLRVMFDTSTWNIDELGLIYTDKQFMNELRIEMTKLGIDAAAVEDVGYSEQGMQDEEFVSCDAYELMHWLRKQLNTVAA